jgi:phospholipid-binding lipoprotein MlaA
LTPPRQARRPRLARVAFALTVFLAMAACAPRPDPADPEAVEEYRTTNDPLEPLNRASFFVNDAVDTLVLRPAAEAYTIFIPPEVRQAIGNVLANLRTPVILANDLLQGETQRAGETIGRFVVNTTVGVGGIFDAATRFGLLGHTEDFGQTLAVWGAPEGPYLFIPVLGPSNPRDLSGAGVDVLMSPFTWRVGVSNWDTITVTRQTLNVLDTRAGVIEPLDAVRAGSLDPYATIRSAYRQRRNTEIRNQDAAGRATRGTGFGVAPQTTPPARPR